MKRIAILGLLALLAACGGGGSADEPASAAKPVAAPQQPMLRALSTSAPAKASPVNPGCTMSGDRPYCELIANTDPIGVGVAANNVAVFTNNTGVNLQIDQADAYTGETSLWGEYCIYLVDDLSQAIPNQAYPGIGEVGCAHKDIGEDYPSLTFGGWSGLLVKPGQMVVMNSHVEPANIGHTYALKVRLATTALYAWRMPQQDAVIPCTGTTTPTAWTAHRNDTGRVMGFQGAEVYSVSAKPASPSTTDHACAYVLDVNGNVRWSQCGINARGSYSWPTVEVQPGEYIAAQSINTCSAPAVWDWAAFLRVW